MPGRASAIDYPASMLTIPSATIRTLCSFTLVLLLAASSYGQTGRNVAVVINENSPASIQIGEHYAKKRAVPAENIIRIKTGTAEEASRQDYSTGIESPIAGALSRHALQDRVLYIVLTKGVPLRIIGPAGQNGTGASVDSELTLLYRRMTGRPVPAAGFIENPYHLGSRALGEAKPFSHRTYDIYLVTRLDAFTTDEAIALIDRADAPANNGAIILDQRAEPAAAIGDRWMAEAARSIRALAPERAVLLEESTQPAAPAEGVIGYYSGGSTDKSLTRRGSGMKFVPGAVAATLVSTDARTFQAPPDAWRPREGPGERQYMFGGSAQSLLGDLIREGVTGAVGNVSEPYLQSSLRPQIFFPAYLSGFNLAEAAYLALPHLGWQSVVIGDPLCAPFRTVTTPASELEPPLDAETELPAFFSAARLEHARPAMKALPARVISLIIRAESRQRRGDEAGARQSLEEAVALFPGAAPAQMQLALMHEEAGETDPAIARYREVLKAEPNNVIALNNLAYSLGARLGSLEEALPLARRAMTLAPGSATIVDTAAWIEHLAGNDKEAARLLAPAIQKSTGIAEVHFHAAVILAAVGNREGAEAQFKEALRLDPKLADREDGKALRARLDAAKK